MFTHQSPILNLHGETSDTCVFLVNDFINDNVKLKQEYIGIVHGKSSHILRDKVYTLLKQNKNVDSFKLDMFNPGLTIVKLRLK